MFGLGAEFPFMSEVHQPCSGSHTDKISEVRWTWNCTTADTLQTCSVMNGSCCNSASGLKLHVVSLSIGRGSVPTVKHNLSLGASHDRWCFCPGWSQLTSWLTLTSTHPHLSLHQSRTRWRLQLWLFLYDSRPHHPLTSTKSCESLKRTRKHIWYQKHICCVTIKYI